MVSSSGALQEWRTRRTSAPSATRLRLGLRAIPAARKRVEFFVEDDTAREVRVISITYAGRS